MSATPERPIAIFYEHPEWFRPVFAELDRRGTPYVKIHAGEHAFDPAEEPEYSLVFNRMSPSAFNRGNANAIFYTTSYLGFLREKGIRVINGYDAWLTEISKAHQLALLHRLGLPYPKARAINHASQATGAAAGLRFPIVIKPNIGGSGAGVRRFDSAAELARRLGGGELELGIDSGGAGAGVHPAGGEPHRARGGAGRRVPVRHPHLHPGNSFDLCPADVCQRVDGAALDAQICAVDAPKRGLRVEGYSPPAEIREQVEAIMRAAHIDVGGIEYMIDARDGQLYFYDINALSNFVADAPNVIGFDPFARLADYLEEQAGIEAPVLQEVGV
jgi:hypothetical protein